jgi:hypothetical protein
MKKTTKKNLELSKETIVLLTAHDLGRIAGGSVQTHCRSDQTVCASACGNDSVCARCPTDLTACNLCTERTCPK